MGLWPSPSRGVGGWVGVLSISLDNKDNWAKTIGNCFIGVQQLCGIRRKR